MPALLTPSGAAAAQFARLDGIVTLVDAKHIEQHLDEEKPEGAENEAVEQVAFADRLLLNKCDLASGEEELQRVEARLRAINAFAPIQRCEQAEVDVSSVLGIRGFDLQRTLEMEPGFLDTQGAEHQHDESVSSMSIVQPGEVDGEVLQDWLHTLLQTQGASIFRMKGVLSVAGSDRKLVYQAVHMILQWTAQERWPEGEARVSRLVFIGKALDRAQLRAGFAACVLSPELLQRKAAKKAAGEQMCAWAEAALPAAFAGEAVAVAEVRCAKPSCPQETRLTVRLAVPKELTLAMPLEAVGREDVVAAMRAWEAVLQRGRPVQAWVEQALPAALAGQRVMVDEVETTHVTDRCETWVHVLAAPPWSMKVIRRLEEVTQENITQLLALAALCGSSGVPSVR